MEKLTELRTEIEKIDADLIDLIIKRLEIAKKIGDFKKENSLPIFDPKREEELKKLNISKVKDEFKNGYEEILNAILKASKDVQL